ncbi:MarC family protein [Halothiobacillus sp.]|uniref:MarC family protein n=1 Tax=Halothiobacillus sp. TaxID=1891311 RepID=UPI002AD245B4|nr:MarC family protein [Halothiobacillus sp.]
MLPDLIHHMLAVFMAFLAMMNPVANAVIFLGLTAQMGVHTTRVVAWRSVRVAFLIVLVFILFGPLVFSLFGITLSALRIAGGILISLVGFRMLHGEHSRISHPKPIAAQAGGEVDSEDQTDIAITPLAIPVLAGPGTIATAMSYSPSGKWLYIATTLGVFVLICVITFYAFIFAERILARIGRDGIAVVTRLMGLILAVIGVQMFLEGLKSSGVMG